MGAFLDRLTAFGQPLTIAAVLMRIGLAMVIGCPNAVSRSKKAPIPISSALCKIWVKFR